MEKKLTRVDFHTHADPLNIDSAKRNIELAFQSNVVAIAVFAKEQVLPYYDQIIEYGRKKGIEVITGIESLTIHDGKKVEMIGLDYDHEKLKKLKEDRELQSNLEMARTQREFLESKGYVFEGAGGVYLEQLEAVMEGKVSEKAIRLCETLASISLNRKLIDDLKLKNHDMWANAVNFYTRYPKYSDSILLDAKFLYLHFFDVDKEGFNYVKERLTRPAPTILEQINEIHSCGGVVLYSPEGQFDVQVWKYLLQSKVDGIMAFHANYLGFDEEKRDIPKEVIRQAINDNLLILGGSDFTGGNWNLGTGDNNKMYMGINRLRDLRKYERTKDKK